MNEMNTDKIDALLEKFYDGSATDDEERVLAAYFRSEKDIPSRYAADRDIILGLGCCMDDEDIPLPEGLESRLNDMIDRLADEEGATVTASNVLSNINWKTAASIAACAAIAIGVFFTFIGSNATSESENQPVVTAQNSEKSAIDTIRHNMETIADNETQHPADNATPKASPATAETKPDKPHSHRTTKATSDIDEATAQRRIDEMREPASPDEAVLIAEAVFQKLAMRLERSAIQLDITETKIDMIPETIELSKY